MKKTLNTIIIAVALAAVSHGQSLLQKTEAQKIAERIDAQQVNLIVHIESQLAQIFAAANTPDQQQAIMDALGKNAGVALQRYGIMYMALKQLNPSTSAAPPSTAVFKVNADGTVTYTAPTQ